MKITILRSAPAENAQPGQSGLERPLTSAGIAMASALGKRSAFSDVDRWVASPARRAQETISHIKKPKSSIVILPALLPGEETELGAKFEALHRELGHKSLATYMARSTGNMTMLRYGRLAWDNLRVQMKLRPPRHMLVGCHEVLTNAIVAFALAETNRRLLAQYQDEVMDRQLRPCQGFLLDLDSDLVLASLEMVT